MQTVLSVLIKSSQLRDTILISTLQRKKLRNRGACSRIIKGQSWDLNPALWLQNPYSLTATLCCWMKQIVLLGLVDDSQVPPAPFQVQPHLPPSSARKDFPSMTLRVHALSLDLVQHSCLPNGLSSVARSISSLCVPWPLPGKISYLKKMWIWGAHVWLPKGQM